MTTSTLQRTKPAGLNEGANLIAKHIAGSVKANRIAKLKVKHAAMTLHGKEGPGGSRIQFGYTKRLEAIGELEKIGMNFSSVEIRKSVNDGLMWGASDPAEPVSAAATKAMEHIKQSFE